MELDHEFTIPVPVDRAWSALLDVERVAPCVPGATLDSVDGDEFIGRLKVKVGAMTITYRGTARILKADESARTVTIEGAAKEARGSGTASVTVRADLQPVAAGETDGESTRVTVHTRLSVTGRPAQFGRSILSEVGGKLITRFAKALSAELAAAPESAAAPAGAAVAEPAAEVPEEPVAPSAPQAAAAPSTPQPPEAAGRPESAAAQPPERRSAEAIDLFEVAGPSVAKRVAPVAAVVAALTIWRVFRRRGRHHR